MKKNIIMTGIIINFMLMFVIALSAYTQIDMGTLNHYQDSTYNLHQQMADSKREAVLKQWAYMKQLKESGRDRAQTNYDVLFYDIKMKTVNIPDETVDSLYGDVKMVARATIDGVTEIEIDFTDNNPIDSLIAPSGSLSYTRTNNVVTITLDQTYNTDEQFEFEMFYRHQISFDPMVPDDPVVFATYSEPYGSRDWWPCKDRPDDKADSFKIAITVDTAYYVGSNGTLDSTIEHGDGWHTFYYTEHYPMVTYLFSIAVADYVVWHDEWVYNNGQDTMPITNAVFPEYYDQSVEGYGIAPEALTIFSDRFGLYPFTDEKYGHSQSRGNGAMEHQTMSTMGISDRIFEEWVVAHELSHQWWGDMITCESWGHLWLNEGFATYCEALYFEGKYGEDEYHAQMWKNRYYDTSYSVFVYDTTGTNFFSSAQYDKGAWVLHMLRKVVGDSLFFAGLQAYYNSFKYGTATTEDFRDVMETATGWELDWFFEEWVYGRGYPYYYWSYWDEPSDSGGTDVYFIVNQIHQTNDPEVFTMPVSVQFVMSGLYDTTCVLWIDQKEQIFKFHFDGDNVMLVHFDPELWVLELNYQFAWGIQIITMQDEISDGQQFQPYTDTIEVKGGFSLYTFSLSGGALPNGYNLNSDGIISGTTNDTGLFTFTVYVEESGNTDQEEFTIYVSPTDYICGDINNNGEGPNVEDLSYLVSYLFEGGPPPPIIPAANVDGITGTGGPVDVADLSYLVDYLFTGGPTLVCE